ncbi:MAG: hypothetical protein ACRD4K_03070 [Candidatus Acidiferrales bacterium]
MRKTLIYLGILALGGGIIYWRIRSQRPPVELAYCGERKATLWSSSAQVREPLTLLSYGEKLDVLSRLGDNVKVRTGQGVTGWVDQRQLMDPQLWDRVTALFSLTRAMPVQAVGHTKAVSNLHIEPGREALRIVQVGRTVPVDVLERKVMDVPTAGDPDAIAGQEPRREDWLLVHAKVQDLGEFAGWVLGRFIELDMPAPLPDYANAAGVHVAGWFVLNHVPDPSGPKPQYLVIATRGGEGQPCDFTMLRAYTWGSKRKRYETAYTESGLCGLMPVHLTTATQLDGDADFWFNEITFDGKQEARYHMHQTLIRRVREPGEVKHPRVKSAQHK